MSATVPKRLFLLVSALLGLVILWFVYRAYQSIQLFGDPNLAASGFHKFDGPVLPINVLLLLLNLVLAVWIKVKNGNGMYFWYALLLFVFFLNLDLFWLSDVFFHFKKANHLWRGGVSLAGVMAIALSIIGATVTLVVFLLSNWWYRRHAGKRHQ